MPYGRGGAGNIEALQREREQAAADVEAQQPKVLPNQPDSTSVDHSEPPQYAHTGRGGAGNYYSPRELATTGSFAGTEVVDSDQTTASAGRRCSIVSVQQSAAPTVHKVGRGGAGNYDFSAQARESSAPEGEQSKQRDIESSVVQDVEEQLAVPPKARIPDAGVYRG